MVSQVALRWKSGSAPAIFTASSQRSECVPSKGFQWNLQKVEIPSLFTSLKAWTPNPCIMR